MPLPTHIDLASECVLLSTGPGELCITFPGGATLCAQAGFDVGDPATIVKSLLGQINTALVPLAPFFDMLDLFKAIFDCIQAIPDCITQLNPGNLLNCIPHLAKAVNKLLALIPPFPIFVMVKGILRTIIVGLQGVKLKLKALIDHALRISRAGLRAAQTGNLNLQAVVDCAAGNLDAYLQNMNAEFAPLNRLIGLVNVLLELAQLECIPAIGGIASVSEEALIPLDAIIEFLTIIEAAIPGGLPLIPTIQPGECL